MKDFCKCNSNSFVLNKKNLVLIWISQLWKRLFYIISKVHFSDNVEENVFICKQWQTKSSREERDSVSNMKINGEAKFSEKHD